MKFLSHKTLVFVFADRSLNTSSLVRPSSKGAEDVM